MSELVERAKIESLKDIDDYEVIHKMEAPDKYRKTSNHPTKNLILAENV